MGVQVPMQVGMHMQEQKGRSLAVASGGRSFDVASSGAQVQERSFPNPHPKPGQKKDSMTT